MLSKKFIAWFGVGVLSVATIPTFAAPHLAKLVARKPAPAAAPAKPAVHKSAATATPKINLTAKPTATKSASLAKPTATLASHKPAPLSIKKTATKTTTKSATKTATKLTAKPAAKTATKTVATAPKATAGRLQAIQQTNKPTASSTAKKLLH
jgi:hypothetical protein